MVRKSDTQIELEYLIKSQIVPEATRKYGLALVELLAAEVPEEATSIGPCIRNHQCATEGQGPCNGWPRTWGGEI